MTPPRRRERDGGEGGDVLNFTFERDTEKEGSGWALARAHFLCLLHPSPLLSLGNHLADFTQAKTGKKCPFPPASSSPFSHTPLAHDCVRGGVMSGFKKNASYTLTLFFSSILAGKRTWLADLRWTFAGGSSELINFFWGPLLWARTSEMPMILRRYRL